MNWSEIVHTCMDDRRVVLIKSLATNNRFYALVPPSTGIRNADTVERIPDDLLLGIAYPCLEDGLNDFAVIRTTYETLDFFPDDEEMRRELMEIVDDARGKLVRRLSELRDHISALRAHFLGTNLDDFRNYALDIVRRGYPRRNLDSMMKLNVFSSVAEHDGDGNDSGPLFYLTFRDQAYMESLAKAPARKFVAALFGDVLESVQDDANYKSRYTFDRSVFQKFIALMFVNYATTDPIFYGTNKADYGVSADRPMDDTPLYVAVGREMRAIEKQLIEAQFEYAEPVVPPVQAPVDGASSFTGETPVELPGTLVNEDVLLVPISSICAAANQLTKSADKETAGFGRLILSNASRLIEAMKQLEIVSMVAYDPGAIDNPTD